MIPALVGHIFLLEFAHEVVQLFHFHFVHIVRKILRGIEGHDRSHGDHDEKTGREKSSKQLMDQFRLHGPSCMYIDGNTTLKPAPLTTERPFFKSHFIRIL